METSPYNLNFPFCQGEECNDEHLVRQAKKDKEAFGALYRKYARAIYRYFLHRVGQSRALAEDLMQETFMRAFRNVQSFSMRGFSYFSYLKTVAHSVLVNFYRSPKPLSLEEVGELVAEAASDFDNVLNAEAMWREVKRLPASQRKVIVLRYRGELPIKIIAQRTGKSENATKLVLSRARKKLAVSLSPYQAR